MKQRGGWAEMIIRLWAELFNCIRLGLALIVFLFTAPPLAFGVHPLITDDTGTQGQGNFQVELNTEYSPDRLDGVREDAFQLQSILSWGIWERADLVVGIPYQHVRLKESGLRDREEGISDLSLELKWRFWELESLSLAVKPGITFPTGDKDKGLGAGRLAYSLFFHSYLGDGAS